MARFSKIQAYFTNKEIVQRVLFTLLALLIFRMLSKVPAPGVDADALQNLFGGTDSGFFNIANVLAGGTLTQFSIISVGIFAFISASIIFQLLGPVVPKIDQLQKMGEVGRKIINQWTRILTVPLALFQAFGIYLLLKSNNSPTGQPLIEAQPIFRIISLLLVLTAGTMLLVWLSELISEFGVGGKLGGGVSVIVTSGILASLPTSITRTFANVTTSNFLRNFWIALGAELIVFAVIMLIVFLYIRIAKSLLKVKRRSLKIFNTIFFLLLVAAIPAIIFFIGNYNAPFTNDIRTLWTSYTGRLEDVETRFGFFLGMALELVAIITFFNESYRKIPIKFVRRIRSRSNEAVESTSYLPIKVLAPGVMPLIFTSSMLLLPQVLYRFFGTQISHKFVRTGQVLKYASQSWLNQQTSLYYQLLSFMLIVLFSLFYITIIMKPEDVGDDLRRRNSFIPGVRPGKETIDYMSKIILRIGFWGGLVLAVISSLPYLIGVYHSQTQTGLEYFIAGGTSILIVVPTILAIKMQLDALVLTKNYEQFEDI